MNKYLAVVLVICFTTWRLSGQSLYVNAQTGNDSNNGNSPQTAWQTIQKSMDSATAGSSVWIAAGTYTEELTLNVQGTPNNRITFRNMPNQAVFIDGANANRVLLNVESKKHFNIIGLMFQHTIGNNSAGVLVSGASGDFDLRRNVIQFIRWTANANTVPTSNDNCNPLLIYGDALAAIDRKSVV